MRRRQAVQQQNRTGVEKLPAPLRGWVENDNLAANQGVGCTVLENWFPEAATLRVRRGMFMRTALGSPTHGLIAYRSGAQAKLFGATATNIYDVSLFPATAGTPVWTQTTNGRWSYVQFAIAGNEFLVAVNGADLAIYYNGTEWNPISSTAIRKLAFDAQTQAFVVGRVVTGATSGAVGTIAGVLSTGATSGVLKLRAVTGTFQDNENLTTSGVSGGSARADGADSAASAVTLSGVATNLLDHVWLNNERLWFVESGTTKAWYLTVASVGGTATSFDLGGEFSQGGSLLFGATWSSDSGSGFRGRNVFVSTQGEVVVYEGIDPGDADTWQRVGRYQIGRPISKQTWQAGGDLIIATEDGLVPMSAVVSKDRAALSSAAITFNIEPSWRRANSTNTTGVGPSLLKWQGQTMGLVAWPHRNEVYVVNLITGGWAKWTGIDARCMALHNGVAYYGDNAGNVFQMEAGGTDNGAPYICRLSWLPEHLGAAGTYKMVTQMRAIFRSLVPFRAKLSAAENYGKNFPTPPSAPLDVTAPALWDSGIWDTSLFDDSEGSEERVTAVTQWVSVGASGYTVSPQVQITAGSNRVLDAELVAVDVAYILGETVV